MDRRDFIASLLALPVTGTGIAGAVASVPPRQLLLVEMNGGNDGLNTVIPYSNSLYQQLRPTLAVSRDQVLQIDRQLGLHPSLKAIYKLFNSGELAIINGVGYRSPNRSHFRSIDIWDTASSSNEYLTQGWLGSVLPELSWPVQSSIDAIVLGRNPGPVTWEGSRSIVLERLKQLSSHHTGEGAVVPEESAGNQALIHLQRTNRIIHMARGELTAQLKKAPATQTPFPKSALGRRLEIVARLLAAGVAAPVYKVSVGSFDTHSNQLIRHARLLEELSSALQAFRSELLVQGRWNDVLVMTYSEFGRRVRENGSRGTDHGTAAPHLFLGGRVIGGLYGAPPDLEHLESGDLIHKVDFRSLYNTVATRWWHMPHRPFGRQYEPIDCLRS